ncbi:Major allergen Alt a 1 [Didymella keratinophila]|nr:Major allergen Alt a 1 [Didymella keratinophila]
MQFKTIAASLLVSAGLSMAAPLETRTETCPVVQQGDYVWKIDDFYARKLDGKTISSLGFNIKATNEGTLDFNCTSDGTVEDGKFYQCGGNSSIYFAYQADRSGLLLRQDVSDDIQYVATTTLPNYCHAGGAGANDFVCQGVSPAYITLVQSPVKLE